MSLWDPATDPLPPLQPKEVGYRAMAKAFYKFLPSNEIMSDVYYEGWQFSSYSRLVTQGTTSGSDVGEPEMTFSYNNYTDPTDPQAILYAKYSDTSCSFSTTEGNQNFPGYDEYQNLLLEYYAAGIPVTYAFENYMDYGLCHVYTVPVRNPNLNPIHPPQPKS